VKEVFFIPKPIYIYTQARNQTSGDPSGVNWNYRGLTSLYKFTTPCYIRLQPAGTCHSVLTKRCAFRRCAKVAVDSVNRRSSAGKLFQVSGPETAKFLHATNGCGCPLHIEFSGGSRPQVSTSSEMNDRPAELSETGVLCAPQTFLDQHRDLVCIR